MPAKKYATLYALFVTPPQLFDWMLGDTTPSCSQRLVSLPAPRAVRKGLVTTTCPACLRTHVVIRKTEEEKK